LVGESWDALFAEATAAPEQPVAQALEFLFEALNGLHNTRAALFSFVEHRSDWWAFTQHSNDPVAAAAAHLHRQLDLDRQTADAAGFWNSTTRDLLSEFAALLGRHATKTNLGVIASIEAILENTDDADTAFQQLLPVFLTASGTHRKRASSKTQRKSMTDAGEDRFLELHEWFCEQLDQVIEVQNRRHTRELNGAWYRAGQRMLEHYQRIKRERRLLDFADLEWNACCLLNHPEHAHWIQYKLDQRIDHLLIDEFQDTNPTQWRLILPLLEEMAAGGERWRSLFIVGDAKQSIYRFRRGTPRLLDIASEWMQQHLDAGSIHLDHSWRSSPAIIDCVNRIFRHPDMEALMPGFKIHSTHQQDLWGRVELWPLITARAVAGEEASAGLRNPLQQARLCATDDRHYREGQAIARRIQELVAGKTAVYNDILILMRSRTHLADYEAALRDRGIPYLSLDRGSLLQSLEIRDLVALLTVLMTPQDNLALAQVLKSPVFSVSDEDLVLLASDARGPWIERLEAVADRLAVDHPLVRARRLLDGWRTLAGHLPIHDLLERIFHEANLVQRYQAAFPATQVARVRANLTRFIELALETDAGRYPTLPRFLERVRQLRGLEKEGPNQATPQAEQNQRVCLLTIHAAKGLEAPVVFLADSTSQGSGPPGSRTLVRWPAEAERPTDFLLLGNSRQRDRVSSERYVLEQEEEQRESANLLYVALTRAKSMLVVSGCAPSAENASTGWYGQIANALCDDPAPAQVWTHCQGEPPVMATDTDSVQSGFDVDTRLSRPFSVPAVWREIAPSRSVGEPLLADGDQDGRTRGLIIHRMLQLVTQEATGPDLLQQVAGEFCLAEDDPELLRCRQEVDALVNREELAWLFKPTAGTQARNEVPIQYLRGQQTVYGIIDRLLIGEHTVHLVDYKTHRSGKGLQGPQLVSHYRPQMDLYRDGVQKLWPDHRVNSYLLLTEGGVLLSMD
ncbi:MAG TPA: DNA helicase UvrD, partial [Gammaproteobacteria bacterium]|nr:DNA helicase UvrD [Gammaproteobacteria bacterium]